VGVVAWLIPIEFVLLSRPLLSDKPLRFSVTRLSGDIVLAVIAAALAHIALVDVKVFGGMPIGGLVGELFGEIARGLFSTVGSFLIGLTAVALILVERAAFSFIDVAQRVDALLRRARERFGRVSDRITRAWSQARVVDQARREEARLADEPRICTNEQADAIIVALADDQGVAASRGGLARAKAAARSSVPPSPADEPAIIIEAQAQPDAQAQSDGQPQPEAQAQSDGQRESEPVVPPIEGSDVFTGEDAFSLAPTPMLSAAVHVFDIEPKIVDTSVASKTVKSRRRGRCGAKTVFQLPSPELLDAPIGSGDSLDEGQLKATARLLEKTLRDYGVEGKVQEIHPGPTVTLFEVSPAPGTKVSKVASLADDLALGLSRKVRIIAPIPGKNRIGFEVPNAKRLAVSLRELVESRGFMEMDAPLPCVLGRDIIGRPYYADLASMPHVIVAGATGAGKSVGLNVMLISLLFRRSPEDLRLLMIDPKVVELAPFDNIPHMLFPVVTDMKQASNALRWTVDEMERRYQLFADAGTRNIITYNGWVKRVLSGEIPPPPGPKTVNAVGSSGEQLEIPAAKDGSDAELPKKLPYIVVVVEEFADLMMQQGKEVEASVARLAQKARAAGIHVILATQRPSVDVITGMIKANFPTRIAYRVAQKVDSRTILDQQGAEHLLGQGDMLVKMNGTNDVKRVQCPFVSEEEVQLVTDMLRQQGEPEYDESIVQAREAEEEPSQASGVESDPLYDQAVRLVAESGKCSTSWIQRKLGIGYNRAAKIVESMERHGIVGPPNGSKPREILVSPH
jgi:S-DNA-T family DNA segregation ATPase FtsK/SpoIIIE